MILKKWDGTLARGENAATTHLHTDAGPRPGARRQVRILLAALIIPFAVATAVGLFVLWPANRHVEVPAAVGPQPERAEAVLRQVTLAPCSGTADESGSPPCTSATAEIRTGAHRGETVDIPETGYSVRLEPGDRVVIALVGGDDPGAGWYLEDFARRRPMLLVGVLFAAAVVLLGRWRGVFALTLSNRQLGDVLTGEVVAQEIVRTLVGSIGLVASVPITTALTAFVATRHREPPVLAERPATSS